MKKKLSILAFLALAIGVQAQTENPKDDPQVMEKFATQIHNLVMAGEWWQLEQLCNEKADSIYDPFLAFGRGMAASRFLQQQKAIKDMEMCLYKYTDDMPDPWIMFAGQELVFSLGLDQEYDHAAKVSGDVLKYFSSDESQADKFRWPITYFKMMQQRNETFAKYPKMTLSHDSGDISIPFRIDSVGENKSTLMMIDGTLHSTGSAQVQGKPACMVFDTGCGMNTISRDMYEELQLKAIDVEVEVSGAAKDKASFVMADSMQLGNVMVHNIKFVVSESLPPGVDLLIGLPIMSLMDQFTMDFENSLITSPTHLADYSDKNFVIDPEGSLRVRIFHNSKPLYMDIDTGNGRHNNLDYKFYTENQEELDRLEVQKIQSNGFGGSFTADYAVMKDFDFMLNGKQYCFPSIDVIKDKLDVALAQNNMGLRFMSSFKRVTISLKDAHIEFE